ncbi:MAG: adenylyltransferase/cytidyltransferase family protein [Bacteroidota bacterium]
MKKTKVFVTGCFDMLHSGHVAFLNEAASYGDLYIGLGSDSTISSLKGRDTINSEEERKYMLESMKAVHGVVINRGSGTLDFLQELDEILPDVFVVNEDGHSPEKERICREKGIEYRVLKRIPHANLPVRSTTSIRRIRPMPYRIDLAGTWIDQPYVSEHHPGWAITVSIEPTIEFNERSGMATSTRKKAIELWNSHLPPEKPEKLARMLFRYDNEPGAREISGSQDAIGITMPGINRFFYDKGQYWPTAFESIQDPIVYRWLEEHLFMVTLWPRPDGFDVLGETHLSPPNVRALTDASEEAWRGLISRDLKRFATGFLASFKAQTTMFPRMLTPRIEEVISGYKNEALAWKLSGAGGGGYLILVAEKPVRNSFGIRVRRKDLGI